MSSSAVDARTVIAVEKILDAGHSIYAEKIDGMFAVKINVLPETFKIGDVEVTDLSTFVVGTGRTFPEALKDAHQQLPDDPEQVAA